MLLLATTEVMLALLLAASTAFRDGMAALQAERYEVAIAQFKQVYELETPENVLRPEALYFRGVAQMAAGQREAAMADWLLLYEDAAVRSPVAGHNKMMAKRALDAMRANGVTDRELMSAQDTVLALFGLMRTRNWKSAADYMSPELAKQWEAEEYPPDFEVLDALKTGSVCCLEDGKGKTKVAGRYYIGAASFEMELEKREGRWVLTRCTRFLPELEPYRTLQMNLAAMQTVGDALLRYVKAHDGTWPDSLEALAKADEAVTPELLLWHSPGEAGPTPFDYLQSTPALVKSRPMRPLLIATDVVNDCNMAYSADGRVVTLPAKKLQKWRAHRDKLEEEREAALATLAAMDREDREAAAAEGKAEAERVTQIHAHMQIIATGDAMARAKAQAALRAIGAKAAPTLRGYLTHTDPEVRETARDLIHVEPAAAPKADAVDKAREKARTEAKEKTERLQNPIVPSPHKDAWVF